ncbi:MAG: hypothetical protein AAF628_09175 [Planctomycetota bacterium]
MPDSVARQPRPQRPPHATSYLLAAAALALSAPAQDPPSAPSVDRLVNATTASVQETGDLTVDRAGRIWVAWQSRRHRHGRPGVLVQALHADGRRCGGERLLGADLQTAKRPALAAAGTAVWAAWDSTPTKTSAPCRVLLQRVDGAAAAAAQPRPVHDTGRGAQHGVVLAPRADGGVTAVWTEASGPGTSTVWRRSFDAAGAALGAAAALAPPLGSTARQGPSSIAAWPDGRSVAVWATRPGAGGPGALWARRFAADDAAEGPALSLDTDGDALEPCVATIDRAGFVVAWLRPAATGCAVMVRRFDQEARPQGPAHTVSPAGTLQSGAAVVAGADGRACVLWNRHDAYGTADVLHRWLDAPGTPLGPERRATHAHRGSQARPIASGKRAARLCPDGTLVAAWSGDGGLGDAQGAHLAWTAPATPSEGIGPARSERTSTAAPAPHDPPVRTRVPRVAAQPFGGDPNPEPRGDFGFVGIVNTGWDPPDPHLAVGPNHVVQVCNGGIAFFGKDGTRLRQQVLGGGNGFFGPAGASDFVFDPEVVFDPHDQRFIVAAAEDTDPLGGGESWFLLAVSDDADPRGRWHRYRLAATALGGGGDIDSPNLASDARAIYLAADFFTGGDKYLVYALDKAPLLAGSPAPTPQSVRIDGAQSFGLPMIYGSAPALYMLQHDENRRSDRLRLHAIVDPLTTPVRTTFDLTVPSYEPPGAVQQHGTSALVQIFEARFWSCVWRDGSLWAVHHQGILPPRLRWYEIHTNGWPASGATPTLAQTGELDEGPGIATFCGAIGVDENGDALITYARSSTTEPLAIGRVSRRALDPPGVMTDHAVVRVSAGPAGGVRWGDYGQVAWDPYDPCTLWYAHEYAPGASTWNTWIGRQRLCQLAADPRRLPLAQGGTIDLRLRVPAKAGRPYVVLGSISGTVPGFALPLPSRLHIPLNPDLFTESLLAALASPALVGVAGVLDAAGEARASVPFRARPGLTTGVSLYFASIHLGTGWDFASNPVEVQLTP